MKLIARNISVITRVPIAKILKEKERTATIRGRLKGWVLTFPGSWKQPETFLACDNF